jgi:hypothetical protein
MVKPERKESYTETLSRMRARLEDLLYDQIILDSKIAFTQERIKNLESLIQKEKEEK